MELTEAEERLIEQVRQLDWGKIEIIIQDYNLKTLTVKKDIRLDLHLTIPRRSSIIA